LDYTVKVSVDIEGIPDSWRDANGALNRTFTVGVGRDEVKVQPTANFKPITAIVRALAFHHRHCPLRGSMLAARAFVSLMI
jgi:hypothetical protein